MWTIGTPDAAQAAIIPAVVSAIVPRIAIAIAAVSTAEGQTNAESR
jgi:hypothetical protein